MSPFSEMPLKMWLLFCSLLSSTSLTHRAVWLNGSSHAGLSVEQLEVQELTAAPLLAFVSTGNKGGKLVASWTMGQLSLVFLQGRLRLDTPSLESCPTAIFSGAPFASSLWL